MTKILKGWTVFHIPLLIYSKSYWLTVFNSNGNYLMLKIIIAVFRGKPLSFVKPTPIIYCSYLLFLCIFFQLIKESKKIFYVFFSLFSAIFIFENFLIISQTLQKQPSSVLTISKPFQCFLSHLQSLQVLAFSPWQQCFFIHLVF